MRPLFSNVRPSPLREASNSFSSDQGFSLIELAIVLAILGAIGGIALPILSQQMAYSKVSATNTRQEEVCRSLAAYVLRNNKLPCPADPFETGGAFRGRALKKCGVRQAVGMLPYTTLGLPKSYATDGHSNLMTYAVDPFFTLTDHIEEVKTRVRSARRDNHKENKNFCVNFSSKLKKISSNTKLQILDEFGDSVFQKNKKDRIAFALVSHGKKGWGAYSKNPFSQGRLLRFELSDVEAQNAEDDLVFVDQPFSSRKVAPFRHHLKWVSRDNLMSIYAKKPCGSVG